MDCSEIRPRLGFYLDQSLDPGDMDEISEHLNTCPICLTEVQHIERLESLLGSLAFTDPSNDYWLKVPKKIIQRIHSERRDSWVSSVKGIVHELISDKRIQIGFVGAVAVAAIVLFMMRARISGNDSMIQTQVASGTTTESMQGSQGIPEAPPVAESKSPAARNGVNKELDSQDSETVVIVADEPRLAPRAGEQADENEVDDPTIFLNTGLFALNSVPSMPLRSQDDKSRVCAQQLYPIPFTEHVPPRFKPVPKKDDEEKPILRTFALDTRKVESTKGIDVPELLNTITNIRSNFLETLRIVKESSSLGEKKNIWLSYLGRESDITYRLLGIYNLAVVLTKIADDTKGFDEANEVHKFYLEHQKALRFQMGDRAFKHRLEFFSSIIEMY